MSVVAPVDAATVVCLRRAPFPGKRKLDLSRFPGFASDNDGQFVARQLTNHEFNNTWQVLMGQSEVRNWYKSSQEHEAVMRYPGEFKFPGGVQEAGERMDETALRELCEEFCVDVIPEHATLRLFNVKQTKPVRNRSYLMHNFVALAEENEWLDRLDVGAINAELARKRRRCEQAVASGKFWHMSRLEREALSPEVHEVAWLDISEAVLLTLTSKTTTFVPVNEFQRTEFERYGVTRRDPMFQTMKTVLEVDGFPDLQSMLAHCRSMEDMDRARENAKASFRGGPRAGKL